MVSCVKFYLIAFLALCVPLCCYGHLYDILKVDEQPDAAWPVPPDKLFTFMSAGVANIFWSFVMRDPCQMVSGECRDALKSVSSGLQSSSIDSYKFVDSSGKTPAGFMASTIGSLGDYDQCLSIDSLMAGERVLGKYCAIDMHPVISGNCSRDECARNNIFSLHQVPVFRGMPLINTLCVPHKCSPNEIQQMLSTVLHDYGIKVAGDIHCDTRHSVSLLTKILSLNTHQIIAGLFLGTLITSVVASTAAHLYHMFVDTSTFKLPEIAVSLSLYTTTKSLLWSKPLSKEMLVFEYLKVSTILSGVVGHILVCAEIPISYYVIDHHSYLNWIFSSPSTQVILNDAGLTGVCMMTGIVTALITYPMAKERKLPFIPAIFDRFLRFLPAMMIMTALELLWFFAGNGPVFTRVANFVTSKCTKNWWLNFLFINNYIIDSIDICGGSSFYTSVDLQLFVLGLVVIYVFTLSPKAGYTVSCLCIIASWAHTVYNVTTNEATGILFRANPIPIKISGYFDHVHMVTTTYIPGYLIGLCTGFALSTGQITFQHTHWKHHAIHFGASLGIANCVNLMTLLYNSLEWIPESLAFLVVIFNRTAQCVGVAGMFVYFTILFKTQKSSDDSKQAAPESSFNLLKAFFRLTFAVYVSNYLVIRTLFFTSRSHISPNLIDAGVRILSTLVIIYTVAIAFHLLLLSPLDNVRKYLFEGNRKTKKN